MESGSIETQKLADVNNRILVYDIAKGIGILCVYFGHSFYYTSFPSRIIYSFHMPLFMLISGALFLPQKRTTLRMLLIETVWMFFVPYLIFYGLNVASNFLGYCAWWTERPCNAFLRFLHGTGGCSLWFLLCLASVRASVWIMLRITKGRLVGG